MFVDAITRSLINKSSVRQTLPIHSLPEMSLDGFNEDAKDVRMWLQLRVSIGKSKMKVLCVVDFVLVPLILEIHD